MWSPSIYLVAFRHHEIKMGCTEIVVVNILFTQQYQNLTLKYTYFSRGWLVS